MAEAPIDTIPLFVRAGSILPLGSPVESTEDKQSVAKLRVYPGRDGVFTIYNDDGKSYGYEQGQFTLTKLRWNNVTRKLSVDGPEEWSGPLEKVLEIVRQ